MLNGLLIGARPAHWVKNLIIFAALIFAREYTDPHRISLAVVAFIAFCLVLFYLKGLRNSERVYKASVSS